MKKVYLFSVCLLLILGAGSAEAANVLGSTNLSGSVLNAGNSGSLFINIGISTCNPAFASCPVSQVFQLALTPADALATFTDNPATANFSTITGLLTTGNNFIDTCVGIAPCNDANSIGSNVSATFFPSIGGPNFAGDVIGSIVFKVDTLDFVASNPSFVAFEYTVSVDGFQATIPEPGTSLLVAIPYLVLLAFRKRVKLFWR